MRKEINCATGEVTEHEDAPVTQLTLLEAKATKLDQIKQAYSAALNIVRADTSEDEIKTWNDQAREARNPTLPTPMLDKLALARGITKADLVARIIAKADAYASYVGTQLGTLQKLEDQLALATTVTKVNAVVWPA
jgi:hypothetical protein